MKARTQKNSISYVLEIASDKLSLGKISTNDHAGEIGFVSVASDGFHQGTITNKQTLEKSLEKLISAAEKKFDDDISKVALIVGADFCITKQVLSEQINLKNTCVTEQDIKKLQNKLDFAPESKDDELIHTELNHYLVDTNQKLEDPNGISGKKLGAEVCLVSARQSYLRDLVNVCNLTGLQITSFIPETLALEKSCLSKEDKNLGCVLIDFGKSSIKCSVYIDGCFQKAFTINQGGGVITNDLAIGLNLNLETAELLKHHFGIGIDGERREFVDIRGSEKTIKYQDVSPVLGPRIIELCSAIGSELTAYKGRLGAGVVLTGGGSELRYFDRFLKSRWKIPVISRAPSLMSLYPHQDAASLHYPMKDSSLIGALIIEVEKQRHNENHFSKDTWLKKSFHSFVGWIKELS